MKLVDLSHPWNMHTPGWVGYAGSKIYYTQTLQTNRIVSQRVETSLHVGTHLDGPMHAADVKAYFQTLADAASDWTSGTSTKDYPGYDKMIEVLAREDVHSQRAKSAAFVGSPEEIRDMIADFARQVGGFDVASMQVNTKLLDVEKAKASMRLFARTVMPHFTGAGSS